MRSRSGQATIEAVAVVGIVVALVAAATATGALAWLPTTLSRAVNTGASEAAREPTSGDIAFLDRAIARAPEADGPMLRDAIIRLSRSVGPAEARALALSHLARRYATTPTGRLRALGDLSLLLARPEYGGLGAGTAAVWSEESPRAAPVVRIVAPGDEQRWQRSQRAGYAERAVELGVTGVVALAGLLVPVTSLAAIGISAGAAAMDVEGTAIPSGSREDDVLVCRFVWRRNRAVPGWAAAHPVDALRLALDRRLPAVELIVVRAGTVLSHDVVRSDAATC